MQDNPASLDGNKIMLLQREGTEWPKVWKYKIIRYIIYLTPKYKFLSGTWWKKPLKCQLSEGYDSFVLFSNQVMGTQQILNRRVVQLLFYDNWQNKEARFQKRKSNHEEIKMKVNFRWLFKQFQESVTRYLFTRHREDK